MTVIYMTIEEINVLLLYSLLYDRISNTIGNVG